MTHLSVAIEAEGFREVIKTMSMRNILLLPNAGGDGIVVSMMENLHWQLLDSGLQVDDATQQAEEWTPDTIEVGESAANYKLVQDTVADRPERVVGSSGINMKAALQFDGLTDYIFDDDHAALALGRAVTGVVLDTSPGMSIVVDDGGASTVTATVREGLKQGALIICIETGSTAFATIGEQYLVSFADPSSADAAWGVGIDASGDVFVRKSDGATENRVTTNNSSATLSTSSTYVIRVESNGAAWTISINGVEQGLTVTNSNSGEWPGDIDNCDNSVVGAKVGSGGASNFFEGKILTGGCGIVALSTAVDADKVEEQLIMDAGI